MAKIREAFRKVLSRVFRYYVLPFSIATVGRVYSAVKYNLPLVMGTVKRVRLHPDAALCNVFLNTHSGFITVERHVIFGQGVMLLTGTHFADETGPARKAGVPLTGCDIVIREGAWIGSGAIVLGPCEIGVNSVVAAGAIVTRDVAPNSVVAGVPARFVRFIGETREEGSEQLGGTI